MLTPTAYMAEPPAAHPHRPQQQEQEKQEQQPTQGETQQESPRTPSSSSSSSCSFDYDDSEQKFFRLSQVKPLDLKGRWLGNTGEVISRFEDKLSELQREKECVREQLVRFAENESRFQLSSLRKLNLAMDRQTLYREYMQRTRRPIEKLHPALILNVCAYVEDSLLLALARLRRVSRVFNLIYGSEEVVELFSVCDFGVGGVDVAAQERWCARYLLFRETLLYYKEIKYTVLIPQNSIKEDIELAVDFINEVFKRAYALRTTDFSYFRLLMRFLRAHRVVLALEALTFTDLAVTRKAAIVAFSNLLAFDPGARCREEITKTKYLKMIQMVEDEDYRDSLVVNSKVSAYLQQAHHYELAVFIDTLAAPHSLPPDRLFDLVLYHLHNELKSCFHPHLALTTDPLEVGEATLHFNPQDLTLLLSYPIGNRLENEQLRYAYFPTFASGRWSDCYIFRGEFYYVLLIRPPTEQ